MTITVFTGPGCGGCVAAKSALKRRGIEFEEVPAIDYADVLRDITERTGVNLLQLPVILAGDEDVISGFASEDIEWMVRNVVAA
jgi:glutaredoxin